MDRAIVPALSCLAALTFATAAGCAEPPPPLNPLDIREWKVPWGGHPRDPCAADADAIWFVGQRGHYLARLTPSSGEFFKRDLPGAPGPHNLVVGGDGIVWYAGNLEGYIGRYDPQTELITKIEMPDPAARDPHTLVFDADERHLWFTAQHGNFVGRLTLENSRVDLVPVPTPHARPYGIRLAPDGTPWVVLFGTNRLASVDPRTLAITEYELPAPRARPRRLEVTADGRVWYADYLRGYLGIYDPAKASFTELALPSGSDSAPYGMELDRHGRIWLVETGVQPNLFVGVDTRTARVVSITPVPSGGGTVRHMDYDPATDFVWFGTDAGTIGRADVGAEL